MSFAKEDTLASNSNQEKREYHFEEMVFHIESCRRNLREAEHDLLDFLRHLSEVKELAYAPKG